MLAFISITAQAFAIASTYPETTTVGIDLADGKPRGSGDAGSQTQKDVT